jgi:hypothetical protein
MFDDEAWSRPVAVLIRQDGGYQPPLLGPFVQGRLPWPSSLAITSKGVGTVLRSEAGKGAAALTH